MSEKRSETALKLRKFLCRIGLHDHPGRWYAQSGASYPSGNCRYCGIAPWDERMWA